MATTIQNSAVSKPARALQIETDPRWAAVAKRDPRYGGKFVYAVKTTGVYCRPSCPSRPAKPENIVLYETCDDAGLAGFRPCKRCHPT